MRFILLLSPLLFISPVGLAQDKDKKKDKKPDPRINLILPLGAPPGATTKVTIRGKHLDKATAVKLPEGRGTAKIASKGGAGVPDKNPDQVGDTQVVIDLTLPGKLPNEPIPLSVITPDGETKPHPLLVETIVPIVMEKEPNDGFKQFQELKLPVVVEGLVDRPKDVDVFRFEGKAGQKVSIAVLANRYGSPLDALLTLYDAQGIQVASNDDFGDSTDAKLEVALPATGPWFIVLQDAHDSGSNLHAYRLVVK